MLLTASISKVVTMPASELFASRREMELGNPPSARSAIDHNGTDKPVSHASEVTGSSDQLGFVIQFFFITCEVIRLGIPLPLTERQIFRKLGFEACPRVMLPGKGGQSVKPESERW